MKKAPESNPEPEPELQPEPKLSHKEQKGNIYRNKLILSFYQLKTSEARLSQLFYELKRLSVNSYTSVCAAVVRIFLELAVLDCIQAEGLEALMRNYFNKDFKYAIGRKYDRVFVQQLSPVMMSAPGVLYKRLRRVPLYTWVLDLWPESLAAAGGINNKWVLGFFRRFVKSEYRHSDKILISSRSFEKSVLEYGDYKDKIVYYPQWADGSASGEMSVESLETVKEVESSGVLNHGFKLMFAGAVGEAHGFECLMEAARLTKEHKEIKWVIVGDGRKLDWVRSFVRENGLEETVSTLGRFPAETMPWFFGQADVMLVTLSDAPLFRLYAPAKISSYMAAGKPILAVLNGEGAEVIRDADCGWTLAAGDAEGLTRLALELSQIDKSVLKEKGQNALSYYNKHYVKEDCLRRLDIVMGL